MNFWFSSNDRMMRWLMLVLTIAFFVGGIFNILDYVIVKVLLFSCLAFIIANLCYTIFKETKKSPEEDSE